MHYYNEIDAYAAQWLRNLIAAGHLPPGVVDTRSIVDVQPEDLIGFRQCHFFAGIGGWSLAARLAGWPDDRELWTGSCPCQPFSVAGKGKAQADERHLWPEQFRLIRARRPAVWMGEQVAAAVGKHWLDGVLADLEGIDYAGRAVVVPACAVDAPHRRDRAWIVADSEHRGCERRESVEPRIRTGATVPSGSRAVADTAGGSEPDQHQFAEPFHQSGNPFVSGSRLASGGGGDAGCNSEGGSVGIYCDSFGSSATKLVADANHQGLQSAKQPGWGESGKPTTDIGQTAAERSGRSAWAGSSSIEGHDGKLRRVKPGVRLLAHGVPARVGRLRAYGNAIVVPLASEVIGAYMDCRP